MSETQRKVLRTVFTKELKTIFELLGQKADKVKILSKYNSFEEKYERIKVLDEQVLLNILEMENSTEEELEKEITTASEYNSKYHEVRLLVQDIQAQDQVDSVSNKSFSSKLRLPKIELKKFDGELKNWIGFWSQFVKIHDDDSLGNEDKFDYLLQSMKENSPAYELVAGFPPSKENYLKAVDLLKSRYGKDEFLIEYYVRELLSLVLNKDETLCVTYLYDKLEVQLRALDSLGVTKEKYAAMLFPLVESAIPEPIFKVWERHRVTRNASTKESDNCLKELLLFLKTEVEAEERLKIRENSFGVKPRESMVNYKTPRPTKSKTSNLPSAAVLVSSESNIAQNLKFGKPKSSCLFCEKSSHASWDCFSIFDKTVDERINLIKQKGGCLRCLRKGHLAQKCNLQVKCFICQGRHMGILCQKVPSTSSTSSHQEKGKEPIQSTTNSFSSDTNKLKTTYLQTLNAIIDCKGKSSKVRILCDSGSQKSFIASSCVKKLDLKSNGSILIQQETFGGQKSGPNRHRTFNISLRSLHSDFKADIQVIEQNVICNQVPKFCDTVLIKKLEHYKIILSDTSFSEDDSCTSIDVLLGADTWAKIITPEYYKINDDLVAVKTQLGWTVVGSFNENKQSTFASTMFVSLLPQNDVTKFWDLEMMGITEPTEKHNKEVRDREVVEFFEKTVKRSDETRHFVVQLPWKENHPSLESNRQAAEKRLLVTTRKLEKSGLFEDYDAVFQEWQKKNIIERVEEENLTPSNVHYLPHRAVVKESSTTRIRPVFDASSKDKNGHCVNECLETGPNLIELIPTVLTNFRKYAFGLTADIEKAFLQIEIDGKDRDMLRFLWWEDGKVIVYRHVRVVFGISSSPFLLGAVLNHLLNNPPGHLKQTAELLKGTFYVDNCLTGVEDENCRDSFIKEAQTLLQSGGFNLRGWAGNGNFQCPDSTENVLGMKWSCSKDTLNCILHVSEMKPTVMTRRTLLSCAQKVFDPIGFTAPVGVVPKIILQKTWGLKVGWDEPLPNDLCKEYIKWSDCLSSLNECFIQRRIHVNESSTLHVFSDASKYAFGSCIFLRTDLHKEVHVSLILAKSRVAPTKPITLPRLELMGALTSTRLCTVALQSLGNPDIPVYFWTDSTVVLAWICNKGKWSVFVENRIQEIHRFSQPTQWKHVPGNENPADIVSRGCDAQVLFNSQWWHGPQWLKEPSSNWPMYNPEPNIEEVEEEKRKSVTVANIVECYNVAENLGNRISKYTKIVRTLAFVLRFSTERRLSDVGRLISSGEYNRAEIVLFRLIQKDSFPEKLKSKHLKNLPVFMDENGLYRLKSRLLNNEDCHEYINPVILPSNHSVVSRYIEQQHVFNNHAGVQSLMVILRERVWILKGRKSIGVVVHRCVICKKYTAPALQAPIAPLPEDRTKISACFQVTGVDLAGPLFTKDNCKCWVVIFTCAVYRAVHLELTQSLSTDAFINALRRFIARRGRVKTIYSDNGTNFVGLNKQLKTLDWVTIQNKFSLQPISWKFSPPAAPWWGGFWERLIRILKGLLKRCLGNACLHIEELSTLVCECESIMNNRPLTYISEEKDDLRPLTPAMFIQSLPSSEVDDLDQLNKTSLNKRWRYLQTLRDGLKSRFKKEYLGFLRTSKEKRTDLIAVGDIVLVESDKKQINWSLGKVTKLFPGKDKITRLVQVKTKNKILIKPIKLLHPLEVNKKEDDELQQFCNKGENVGNIL